MTYQELLILLPCHSLEDFPTYHEGEDAQGLLSAWSAMWQPELLANAGQAPTWKRIEDVPTEVKDRLIVVPSMCASRLPTGFAQRVKEEGGCLIKKTTSRAEVVAAALEPIGGPKVDADLAADFLALGYAYLQIQLLTRQMRYSSNLDEVYFKGQAVGAAVAAVEGNLTLAKEKLSACFNVLAEERDHYYPVDAFILELNLTAATTLGSTLRNELNRESPTNLLLTAATLDEMQAKEPQTLEALKKAIAAGKVGIIGGEAAEERLPLMSQDSIVANLRRGIARYEELLGQRPEVFGRWRFGLSPALPGLLTKTGFRGALHACFEEGTIPAGTQFKVRWEGLDGAALDSITRMPLDASKPQTFLAYASKMGESMDGDHVATLCLAHWPGQESEWLGDLRRIAGYCKAMGKFVTVQEYFAQTDVPGHLDRYEADRYKSPYLKQAVIRKSDDPISTSVRYWQRQAKLRAAEGMETLATLVTGKASSVGRPSQDAAACESALAEVCDSATEEQLQSRLESATAAWANCLAGKSGTAGVLVLNPCSYVRRMGLETTALTSPPVAEKPIYAADSAGGPTQVVVDVPPMGYVFIANAGGGKRDSRPLLLAEDNTLRNEFFEAVINPTTGTLAAMHEYKARGNRMSQQLAMRMPGPKQKPGDTYRDPDETARYSVMAADSVEVTIATTALGEITTRGRLLNLEGEKLAGFVQKYRVWRGSRVLTVDIELDPIEETKADPWNSYYCCRFAWGDETSDLFRTANETRQPASGQRFEAPHYIEMINPKNSTTILTGGLPYHRRHEHRMLDSLLITRGERQRKFRVGIGIDLTHPMLDAIGLLTPLVVVPGVQRPASASGWLFHLDSRNVVATHWEPLVEDAKVTGFRTRLLETAGRPAGLTLSAFKPVGSAERVDFLGTRLDQCQVLDGKIKLDLAAHEFVEVVGALVAMIVAIDGPAGAGKSSVSRLLAERLGFQFLDTGAMYRAVALAALERGFGNGDEAKIAAMTPNLQLDFSGNRVLLDGRDVTEAIRTIRVSAAVYLAADNPQVREKMVAMQRQIAGARDTVTEGRDQGTVAFPHAECKIFLTATPEERARRRHAELQARGEEISFAEVLAQNAARDLRDSTRSVGRLIKADEAVEVYTDGMTTEQVIDLLESIVQATRSQTSRSQAPLGNTSPEAPLPESQRAKRSFENVVSQAELGTQADD